MGWPPLPSLCLTRTRHHEGGKETVRFYSISSEGPGACCHWGVTPKHSCRGPRERARLWGRAREGGSGQAPAPVSPKHGASPSGDTARSSLPLCLSLRVLAPKCAACGLPILPPEVRCSCSRGLPRHELLPGVIQKSCVLSLAPSPRRPCPLSLAQPSALRVSRLSL